MATLERNVGVGDRIISYLRQQPTNSDGWVDMKTVQPLLTAASASSRDVSRVLKSLKDRGIVAIRMKNARRYDALKFLDGSDEPQTQKEVVLGILRSYANKRGWVRTDLRKIGRLTKLSDHDLIKIMFDLREQGNVSFRKVGSGSAFHLESIRVAAKTASKMNGHATERPSEQAMREAHASPEWTPPPAEAPQTAPAAPEPAAPAQTYPLIRQLVQRRSHVEAAIKSLEAAGMDDEALALMEKVDSLTPLEKEVVDLAQSLGWPK